MAKKDLTCFTTKEKVVVCKASNSKEGKAIAANKKGAKMKVVAVEAPKKKVEAPKKKVETPRKKVETPRPKLSDKVKKFMQGGQQKGNRLDNLPDDLKGKIMDIKKDKENDPAFIEQQARTMPLIKKRLETLFQASMEPPYDEKLFAMEDEMRDDYRLFDDVGDGLYKISEYFHDEARGLMRLTRKKIDSSELMEVIEKFSSKQMKRDFHNILVKDVNKNRVKKGKLKTNKQILDKYWLDD